MQIMKRPALYFTVCWLLFLAMVIGLFTGLQGEGEQEDVLFALNRVRLLVNPVLAAIADSMAAPPQQEELPRAIRPLLATANMELEIVDSRGLVLFDSKAGEVPISRTVDLITFLPFDYDSQDGGRLRFSFPLLGQGGQLAYAVFFVPRAAITPSGLAAPLARQLLPGVAVASLGILGLVLFQFAFRRLFGQPLADLSQAVNGVAKGDYAKPLPVPVSGDLAAISRAIDLLRLDLRDSLAQQQEASLTHKDLMSKIYHDLKTPISAIKAYAEGLGDGIPGTPTTKRYLAVINARADSLAALVDDLLDHALKEQGQLHLAKREHYSGPLLTNILEPLLVPADSVYPPLVLEGELPNFLISADPLRLEQVIVNLVQNAQKYSPRQAKVFFSTRSEEDCLQISVRDMGPGIPADELPCLFDSFYRGGGSRGVEGSGLGLAICKFIVEGHGGEIWAVNNPGGGSTFSFTLPKL